MREGPSLMTPPTIPAQSISLVKFSISCVLNLINSPLHYKDYRNTQTHRFGKTRLGYVTSNAGAFLHYRSPQLIDGRLNTISGKFHLNTRWVPRA